MKAKYVIIGNSAAAIGCVEGIRSSDPTGDIILISSEPYFTYSRPLISYLLCGKTDTQRMRCRPHDFYDKNRVTALLGRTVTEISADSSCLTLDNGEKVCFEKLLYAAGSRPFIPPIEGLEQVENKFTFMCLDDALALESRITSQANVLILGAGLIGLKCAEGLYGRVRSITVADLADRVLPSILDDRGSQIMLEHLKNKGVNVLLGTAVKRFTSAGADTGEGIIPFDILVTAAGVRPNVELLKKAGADCGKGIIIDNRSLTSLKNIYAAGDCCQCTDITGQSNVLALLPNAYMQGETAGKNMAGSPAPFDKAMPMNSMGVLGLHMITAGSYQGESIISFENGTYKRLYIKNGLLSGYIIIGDVSRAGIYTSLIRDKTPIADVDFELMAKAPQLMAFPASMRRIKLSGPV